MAEQKISNERKKELQQMDPFQAGLVKAVNYAKTYQKQLLFITGAVILVVVVFSSVMYSFQKAENTAAALVNQAFVKYYEIDDPQKAYIEVENDFKTILTEFSNTAAGKMALVQFAKINYDALKFDQSYTYYSNALKVFKNDMLMKNFLLSALGNVCITKKDFNKAREYFMQIENGESALLKDEAKFALAMINETASELEKSKTMYNKLVEEHENSIYTPIAKSKIK